MPTLYADTDTDLLSKLKQLYSIARREKSQRYDNWMRNYRIVNNRIGGRQNNNWQSTPRSSEVYPILSSIVSWVSDQHTGIDITAAADPNSPYYVFIQKIANDLSAVIEANWTAEQYDKELKLVIWDALIYGAGFFKAVWDQSLAGGIGNAKPIHTDPWALYIDPNATSLDDAEYIVEVRRMSVDEIERRFPGNSSILEASASSISEVDEKPTYTNDGGVNRTPKANPGSLDGQPTRWSGVRSAPRESLLDQGIVVYEFWIRENDEYYPETKDEDKPPELSDKQVAEKWRVIVVAANHILLDEYASDLWSYNSHPYDRFVFDDIGELYGVSLVDHLAHPQLYINRLLQALQSNAELIGNPIFLESVNSGLDRVNIINKPGQRLKVSGAAGLNNGRPEWLKPPEMPSYVKDLVQFWISRMENVAGISQGSIPSSLDRTTDSQLASIQEAAFVRIRNAISNLEYTLQSSISKIADLIIDNYTEPRVVAIVGPGGRSDALTLASRHFNVPSDKGATPLKYSMTITAGSQLPTSRQARAAQADKAYTLGLIDRQAWFEANGFPNWPDIIQRINAEMTAGTFNPPGARERARS